MPFEIDICKRGKGFKRRGRRQLGDEVVGVHMNLSLLDSGSEVQVEAAIEALLERVVVALHFSKAVILLRNVFQFSVFRVGRLPFVLLLGGQQILLFGVIGLLVSGPLGLRKDKRRRQVLEEVIFKFFSPNVVQVFFRLLGFFFVHLHPSHLYRMQDLVHFHALPLRRHESPLRRQ